MKDQKSRVSKAKKSVPFTDLQKAGLKAHVAKFDTFVNAAVSLGIDRPVLERMLLRGSCSEKTFEKVIKVICV